MSLAYLPNRKCHNVKCREFASNIAMWLSLLPMSWFNVVNFVVGVNGSVKYSRYQIAMEMGSRGIC